MWTFLNFKPHLLWITIQLAAPRSMAKISLNAQISSCFLWYQPNDLQLPWMYPWEDSAISLLQRCNPLQGGTILTWSSEKEEKQHRENHSTKPQMPAVVESGIYTRLPSPAADCYGWTLHMLRHPELFNHWCCIKSRGPKTKTFTERNRYRGVMGYIPHFPFVC